eukprot:1136405-Pelagomonas_calceolata.AAC.5
MHARTRHGVLQEGAQALHIIATYVSGRTGFANFSASLATLPSLVGRFDCDDEAARARDIAAMALGASANPRLNFDADHYTLEAVELMVSRQRRRRRGWYFWNTWPVCAKRNVLGAVEFLGDMKIPNAWSDWLRCLATAC